MTLGSVTLTVIFILKIANLEVCCRQAKICVSQTPVFQNDPARYNAISKSLMKDAHPIIEVLPCGQMIWGLNSGLATTISEIIYQFKTRFV